MTKIGPGAKADCYVLQHPLELVYSCLKINPIKEIRDASDEGRNLDMKTCAHEFMDCFLIAWPLRIPSKSIARLDALT